MIADVNRAQTHRKIKLRNLFAIAQYVNVIHVLIRPKLKIDLTFVIVQFAAAIHVQIYLNKTNWNAIAVPVNATLV